MKCNFIPITMLKIWKNDHTKFWQRCGKLEHAYTGFNDVKWRNHFVKLFGRFLKYSYIYIPYDPTIPLLRMNARKTKAYVHTKTYTNDHSSFTCSKPKLETTQVSIVCWVDRWAIVYTVGCFSAIKLKDLCTTTWMNFEITMLDGKSQARTHVYCKEFITSCLAMDDNLGRDK